MVYGGYGGRWRWWWYMVVIVVGGDGDVGSYSGCGWSAVIVFCGCSSGWQ